MASRWFGCALTLLPLTACLLLYSRGLGSWYLGDDFGWLYQANRYEQGVPLSEILFRPTIHGTWRPFSERLFLLLAARWFGMDAFPARLWVMLTQLANLLLVGALARRLTGSRAVGAVAGVFWIANPALATVMAWTSSYMHVLCVSCLLAGLWLLARHFDTGRWVYYWLQWAVFLFGFGVMESIVVYPALATGLALYLGHRGWRRLAPLWVASVAFVALHMKFVPKQAAGTYSLHLDPVSVVSTVLWYARTYAWPPNIQPWPGWAGAIVAAALLLFLAGTLTHAFRARSWAPWAGLVWTAATIAPVLPLRDQTQQYYLTMPGLGLAWILACGLAELAEARRAYRWASAALAVAVLLVWLPTTRAHLRWWVERARNGRDLLERIIETRRAHPGRLIMVNSVSNDLFWLVLGDAALDWLRVDRVYLNPDDRRDILPVGDPRMIERFFIDRAVLAEHLRNGNLTILAADQWGRDVTEYQRSFLLREWGGGHGGSDRLQ